MDEEKEEAEEFYSPLALQAELERQQEQTFWCRHPKWLERFNDLILRSRKYSFMIVTTEEEYKRIINSDWLRASGECICSGCGELYRRHPWLSRVPTLHLLCDGTWVKL